MSSLGGPPTERPSRRTRPKLETLAVLALTLILAITYPVARDMAPFQAIEGQSLDWRFRLRGPQEASPEIAIVAIDDRTLSELGRWPFSRAWLAAAVEAVAEDGAGSIAFDLLLVGPEKEGDSGADRALSAAIRRAGNVVVPFAFVYDSDRANTTTVPPAVAEAAYPVVRTGAAQQAARADPPEGLLVPLAAYLEAGSPAHTTVFVQADGNLRLVHPAIGYGGSYYPSFPVEAVRKFLGIDRQRLTLDLGRGLEIGDRFFATDPDMALPINYAGAGKTYRTWSLIDVVRRDFAPGAFRGRLVLLGANAAGVSDRFATPYSPSLAGVEVFANVVDNFLNRGFLRRSAQIHWIDTLAIILCGLAAVSLKMLRRPATAMLAAAGVFGVWSAATLYSFIAWQVWLNFVFPSVALVAGAAIMTAGLAVRETRRRANAEQRGVTLSRYVSPLAISDLQARESGTIDGGAQMAAVMFVDLVGFTHASEDLAPGETARLLRRFHGRVERIARDHGGIIDKYIGDAVLVVFGIPQGSPSAAADALACARQIVRDLEDRTGETEEAGGFALSCGVGIDYGAVTIAEVGGSAHAQVTVTGDTVNVASRLEALTRDWSATVIISGAVADAVGAAGSAELLEGFEELPVQKVRGRDRPIRLWAWRSKEAA